MPDRRHNLCYTIGMISRDVLFYTLSACALAGTVAFVWFCTYLIRIFRGISHLVEDFRDRLQTIDDILQTIKDKLSSTHAELSLLTTGVKELISYFANKRAKRRSSQRPSRSEED